MRLLTRDDYPAYETAIAHASGRDVPTAPGGGAGRRMVPAKEVPPERTYATDEERRRRGRVVEILVHPIFGTRAAPALALGLSRVSRRVNVSFPGRYNATDRHQGARRVRKTYTFSKDWRVHESMTSLTVYGYDFCRPVRTLEDRDDDGRVRKRSPAMAAGLTDHVWTMHEWITMPSVQRA